jgi:hypothetical protein
LRGVSKDGHGRLVAHPSRLAAKGGEHFRMTTVLAEAGRKQITATPACLPQN